MAPAETTVVFRFGEGDPGRGAGQENRRTLRQPRGLHVCPDGSLLVADFAGHCVVRFRPADSLGQVVAGEEGKALPTVDPLKDIDKPLGPPEGEGFLLKRPGDVAVDAQGGILVLDTEVARVQRFAGDGAAAATVAPGQGCPSHKSAHAPEAIKNPRAILCHEDGSLVVVDTWSHRVLRFAAPGSQEASQTAAVLAGVPNSAGVRADQLCFPSAASFGPDGCLYVADTNNHRVQRFKPGESLGCTVAGRTDGKSGSNLNELCMPTGLCVEPTSGNLFVADRANARVLRFPAGSTSGSEAEVVVGEELVDRPWGLGLGADGSLYVSDERLGVVLQLEVPAVLPARPVPPPKPLSAGADAAPPAGAADAEPAGADDAEPAGIAKAEPSTVSEEAMGLD